MATLSDIATRVYAALELRVSDVPAPTVDGWIARAIADLSLLLDKHPLYADAFRAFRKQDDQVVSAANKLIYPAGSMKVVGAVIYGRRATRIVNATDSFPPSDYTKPTVYEPWLRLYEADIEVLPTVFENQSATVYYIKTPATSDTIGDELADLVVYMAAKIGAMETGDVTKLELATKMFGEAMQRIGGQA